MVVRGCVALISEISVTSKPPPFLSFVRSGGPLHPGRPAGRLATPFLSFVRYGPATGPSHPGRPESGDLPKNGPKRLVAHEINPDSIKI